MTRAATAKLGAYTALAGLGLLGALVAGRPELVALAAPFAAVLVAGLSLAEKPDLKALFDVDQERQVQGETVAAELELWSRRGLSHLELLLDLPAGLVAETPNPQLATRCRAPAGRGSSSPTCGPSSPATACAESTGARPPGAVSRG